MEERAIATQNINTSAPAPISMFDFGCNLDKAYRFADTLSKSKIVPEAFKENAAACLIALDMANRMRRNPLEVMQAMYIVHGKPSFSSSFLISLINSSGFYEPLRFRFSGEGETRSCTAWTLDKRTGEEVEGPEISIKMARAEGWYGKNGSKWQTMPEVMLRYRAASFFQRLYCPDVTGGFHTVEEAQDTETLFVATTSTKSVEEQLLGGTLTQPQLPEPNNGKRRKAIWDGFLTLCGDSDRARAAISAITDGRGSKDWTVEDMNELERQLTMNLTPLEALSVGEEFIDEIGAVTNAKNQTPKTVTELEKLRQQLTEGLSLNQDPEAAETWVMEHFKKTFRALTKDDLKAAIAKLNTEMDAREGVGG